jgi:hypothetical protein
LRMRSTNILQNEVAAAAPPVLILTPNMAAEKSNKSSFIRQQSAALSAAEVVAKGKAAGIKFSSQLVYHVRGSSKATKSAAKKTATAQPSAAPSKVAPAESKADFVRAHVSLSPREVVQQAKAEGINLDVGYVYRVRGYDKSKGKKMGTTKPVARVATPRKAAPVPRPISSSSSAEDVLRAVAFEIGLGRAIEILAGERAVVRAMIGR